MSPPPGLNPFHFGGPRPAEEMIDRDEETAALLALAEGGHSFRLVGPRRYGKTMLLMRVMGEAERSGMATVLVDLQDVLSVGEIVVRLERAYSRHLKGVVRRQVDALLKSWNIGLSLGAGGFSATLQRNPEADTESVLLRILELPAELNRRNGTRSFVVFDEIQDVMAVPGADGKIRSVIQHQGDAATYAFAGSAPGIMERLFADPSRPFLEQAVPRELDPLPLDQAAAYIERRFAETGKEAGSAIDPLIEFTRGHPMRTMMLAHFLWERTPPGGTADEAAWLDALDGALGSSAKLMRAIWKALPTNERRVARALAVLDSPVYSRESAVAVGIPRSSINRALEGLRDNADVMATDSGPRLTDPLFELWLSRRGLTPESGDE